jgi:glycosyltransferase involved in cell wall biosynthesis
MTANVPSRASTNAAPVSVIITVLNEAIHIGRCINALRWADEVFVVDGGSSDATVSIATAHGARVIEHPWAGYAAQKNWALQYLPLRNDWILFLDADEIVTPTLAEEISATIGLSNRSCDAYFVNRRMIFLGRWLKHTWWYPDSVVRLVRRSAGGTFEDRSVHERWVSKGEMGYLTADLVHENWKPLHEYLDRLNRYSTLEALEILRWRWKGRSGEVTPRFSGDWAQRRRALKLRVWYRLPFRPFLRFLWMWFVRFGFLDGHAGWVFTKIHIYYEVMIDLKLRELQLHSGDPAYLEYVRTRLPGTRDVVPAVFTIPRESDRSDSQVPESNKRPPTT